jgi:hypothetical protein
MPLYWKIPAWPSRPLAMRMSCLLAAALVGGCAVHRTVVHEGRPFPVERILELDAGWRAGLDRDAVHRLFGPPYATGFDADGYPFWEYRHRGQAITSGGGGLLLVGVVATQAATGAELRLVFGADDRVRQVTWEIAGPESYRALAGGRPR